LDANEQWKLVSHAAFLKKFPGKECRYGTVEVMAQSLRVHYSTPGLTMDGFKIFCKALVLERGNSSCLYSATETASNAWSAHEYAKICSQVPWSIYQEFPDAHAANARKKRKRCSICQPTRWVLMAFVHVTKRIELWRLKSLGSLETYTQSLVQRPTFSIPISFRRACGRSSVK
jgi:hypothetical protein